MPNLLKSKNLILAGQYLLYAAAITPAVVIGNFLFPYISSRTIYFRTLIEIVLLLLLIIIIRNKAGLQIKKNYFFILFFSFAITNIISSLFSFSPALAWFSDIERMWGVFTLIHLFVFYFLLRVFFSGREWKIFLNISIIVSLLAAGYGLAQYYPEIFKIDVFQAGKGRIISTLGNSAYVAIYMLFNIFFALFLFLKNNNNWLKFYYAGAIAVDFYAFTLANIRGASLGLLAGLATAILLYILLGENKKYKAGLAVILIAGLSVLLFAHFNPAGRIARSNPLLSRISSISLSDGTVETRFIGWRAAWKGFKEHPILGVGMDNYNTVFNKYFDANYYLYAPTEPYFDRSHNAILDVLVMNGLVGFIIFLGFPFFIAYYLVKGYKTEKIKLDEFLIFLSLTIAYFIHLVFVFDDLNSYIYFVVLIAFIEYRYHKDKILEIIEEEKKISPNKAAIAAGAIIIIIFAGYNFNIKVALACNKVIEAMRYGSDIKQAQEIFEEALAYNIVPSRNIVMSYINYVSELANNLPALSQNSDDFHSFKLALAQAGDALAKEIKKDPANALLYNRKALLNNLAFLTYREEKYIEAAVEAGGQAIELSREHLQYYYTLSDTYLISGQTKRAIETIERSLAINDKYRDGYYHLARVYLADGQSEKALETAKLFMQKDFIPPNTYFFERLAQNYEDNNDMAKTIEVMELAAAVHHDSTAVLSKLIKLYLKAGEGEKAIAAAAKLAELNESFASNLDYFTKMVRQGKGEELLKQTE